jgi:hypothetical protein
MIPRLLQELVLLKGGFPPEIVEIRNFSVHSKKMLGPLGLS